MLFMGTRSARDHTASRNHPAEDQAGPQPLRLEAKQVSVRGPHFPLLNPTSLSVESGEVVVAAGDPGHGHTALALALGGRLVPSTGVVCLNGRPATRSKDGAGEATVRGSDIRATARLLRRTVALVDVPGVSEPDDVILLAAIVGEELSAAGSSAGRAAATRWLAERGLDQYAKTQIEGVPATVRTRVLAELAAARPGVGVVILTAPDRHGANPRTWRELADTLAATGLAVVATCSDASAAILGQPVVPLGWAGTDLTADTSHTSGVNS